MGICYSTIDVLDGMEITPDMIQTTDIPTRETYSHKYMKWEHVPEKMKLQIKNYIIRHIPVNTETINLSNITSLRIPGFHWYLRKNLLNKEDISVLSKEPIIETLKELNLSRPFTIHTDQCNWIVSFVIGPEVVQ